MDYFKKIEEMQKEFLKNPQENIIQIRQQKEQSEINQALLLNKTPELLKLHVSIHKEYAVLIHKLWSANIIHGGMFKDDISGVKILQRYNEWEEIVDDYKRKKEIDEIIALRLSRAYASSLEIIWNKLKNIIFLAGLNPKNKYLTTLEVYNNFIEFEKKYKINLSKIKSIINSELRNSIGHEDTYFTPPDIIVFLDSKNGREVNRLTTREICKALVETTVIIGAIVSVETTAILSVVRS